MNEWDGLAHVAFWRYFTSSWMSQVQAERRDLQGRGFGRGWGISVMYRWFCFALKERFPTSSSCLGIKESTWVVRVPFHAHTFRSLGRGHDERDTVSIQVP